MAKFYENGMYTDRDGILYGCDYIGGRLCLYAPDCYTRDGKEVILDCEEVNENDFKESDATGF